MLSRSGYVFHTYLMSDQKKKSYIVRGIDTTLGFDVNDIVGELVRAGLPDSIQIVAFQTGFMKKKNLNFMLYRLIVPAGFDESIFKEIHALLGLAVRFTLFRSRSTTQCTNCQSFFHTSAGCHRKFRSVKCLTSMVFAPKMRLRRQCVSTVVDLTLPTA